MFTDLLQHPDADFKIPRWMDAKKLVWVLEN